MDDTPQRIDTLEAKIAFQEDTIASLNEALIGQQTRIDRLEQLLHMVIREVEQTSSGDAVLQNEPPPPHY
jgi:SlyX protein